jgi:hypothetical protein
VQPQQQHGGAGNGLGSGGGQGGNNVTNTLTSVLNNQPKFAPTSKYLPNLLSQNREDGGLATESSLFPDAP